MRKKAYVGFDGNSLAHLDNQITLVNVSRDKFLSVNVHETFNKGKSKLVQSPNVMLLSNDEPEIVEQKEEKLSLLKSLLGESRDAKHILTNYKKMIRVLPDEFDFTKIDKFRDDVKYRLSRPHQVFTE